MTIQTLLSGGKKNSNPMTGHVCQPCLVYLSTEPKMMAG